MESESIIYKLLTLILSVVCFVFVPVLLLLSLPIFLHRFLVRKLAKILNKSLGEMVTTRGCAMAGDGFYNRPETNVCVVITLEGNVDFEKAEELIKTRLQSPRLPDGRVKYPEIKQYMTPWAGFLFYKDDPDFEFKNHVKLHERCKSEQDRFEQNDMEEIGAELLNRKWKKDKPLWDITFVTNCYPKEAKSSGPHTLLILRIHHAVGDGYSWMPMLVKEACQSEIVFAKPNYIQRSRCSEITNALVFPFRAAFELAEICMITFRKLPFWVSRVQSGSFHTSTTNKIALKKLKEIRAFFKVSFSSVVFAATAGAVREFLISKDRDVPKTLPSLIAQPMPDHTEKLRNYMTGIVIEFPTGESDPVARLKASHKNLEDQKNSTVPTIFKYLLQLMGSYFSWMTGTFATNFAITTGMSNFPGGNDFVYFNGASQHKWVDKAFYAAPQRGCCGISFCAISYVDGFRISCVGDSAVVSRVEMSELADLMEKHLDILYQNITINGV